jgi:predicted enzyme related to lactoylglutathione lyase
MLENASCSAVLPASDLNRAKTFWHDMFDLDPVEESLPEGAMYDINGASVFIYETQFAGTAQNTALSIDVPDFDAVVAELRSRGLEFNEYDLPGIKTVDGVAELEGMRGAWFNDSEGNIIGLAEQR